MAFASLTFFGVFKMDYETIVREANSVLKQYNMRMTLRQIFYRLVAKLVIANTLNNYKALSKWLVKARERGDVDEWYIEDRVRETLGGDSGYDDAEGFIESYENWFKNCWKYFKYKMWTTQENIVEAWIEKDALSRLAKDAADEFNVMTCPSRGYSSYSYVRDAVQRLLEHEKPAVILYYGDWDPSGKDIERDLGRRLRRYGLKDFTVKRVALTLDQIQEYSLPPMPAKRSDPRFAKFVADTGGADAVELDALEPPVLQRLIKEAIEAEIDLVAWEERKEETDEEKERLRERLAKVKIIYEEEKEDEGET